MVDAPNSNIDPQQPVPPAVEEKPAGFLATTAGKIIVGGIALVAVLIIIGVIAWIFLFSTPASSQVNTGVPTTVAAASQTASGTATGAEGAPVTDPQQQPLESTFTFRNVFAPTLKQPVSPAVLTSITAVATSTSDGKSPSAEDVDVPDDTLYLVSIQTVDGEKTATFIWNDSTYTLEEGDTLAETPWKVVEIGDSSVVMLYGDTQVTLSTGQGLSK